MMERTGGRIRRTRRRRVETGQGRQPVDTAFWGIWRMRKRTRNWKRKTWKIEKGREKR